MPDHMVQLIGNIEIGDPHHRDYTIWSDTNNGQFSNKTAWNVRSWASCKYGDNTNFNKFKMVHQIIWLITTTINSAYPKIKINGSWAQISMTVEKLKHVLNWRQISWIKPPISMVTANTYGSFNINKGKTGVGAVIRSANGNLIMAFSISTQCTSNNQAEAK
ncbi:hypothetical protein HAX54_031313 [Datura stramonium]|uniref:RNase H type-1 domain-containing protein n=1 Tax=Datura stramonium TaxID=4076 RepID=A0ABS8SC27_DATST|nr:hypothetical protein [Datura stramonium]